jgi:hypothetical protein
MTINHIITYALFAFMGGSWGMTIMGFLIFLSKDKLNDEDLDRARATNIVNQTMASIIVTAVCFAILYFIK